MPYYPCHWAAVFGVAAFLLGACIGSFLNVCIYRIPSDLSVVKPGSHCPLCRRPIAWYHNVPILAYIYLGGRCRYCATRIPPRYMLVELLVAGLFLLAWWKFDAPLRGHRPIGLSPVTDPLLVPVYWLALAGLVLGTFVDFDHMIIPDRVTIGGTVAGLLLSLAAPSLHGHARPLDGLLAGVIGAAAGAGSLWLVAAAGKVVFRKEAMGFGDVKLMGAIGAFLGWRAVLFVIVVSSLAGSLVGIALVLARRRELQSRIPYGPYLSLAAALWIYWGPGLWQAYLSALLPRL